MNIKKRLKRLEVEMCPTNLTYRLLIIAYARPDHEVYIRNGEIVKGKIKAVMIFANGKFLRMPSADSEEGQKLLKQLGYKKHKEEISA